MNRVKILFFTILTLLAIYSLYRTYADVNKKAEKIDNLALKVEELQTTNNNLKLEIAQKKTRDFIEHEAVSKLGLAKVNQDVIVVNPNKDTNSDEKQSEGIKVENRSPVQQWRDLLLQNNFLRVEL